MHLVNPDQLAAMTLDLSKVQPGTDLIERFPHLGNLNTLTHCHRKDRNELLWYILLMYDPKSPFKQIIADIKLRKKECAKAAGLKEGPALQRIFDFKDKVFMSILDEWLKSSHNRVWSMIVSNEQVFYEYQERLLTPVESDKGDKDAIQAADLKSKLMDTCDEIHKRLEGYYRELYGDKETAEKMIIEKRWTPESIGSR